MNERTTDILRAALLELVRIDEPAAPAAMLAVEMVLEDAAVDVGGGAACYRIRFKEGDGVGTIFEADGLIHLCGQNGLSIRVPSREYHSRMHEWITGRMARPLIFTGDDGTRCMMVAPNGPGDVVVELHPADVRPAPAQARR